MIEVGLCYVFCDRVFGRENRRKYHWIVKVVMILALAWFWQMNRMWTFINHLIYLMFGVITAISICWIHRTKYNIALGISWLYYTVLGLVHIFFSFIALLLFKQEMFMDVIYWKISGYRLLVMIISLLSLALVYRWAIKWICIEFQIIDNIKWQVIIFALFCWWMVAWGQVQIIELGYKWIIWSLGSLIFTLVMILVICMLVVKHLKADSEIKLTDQKKEMMSSFYGEMESMYKNCVYTSHDIKNHILVLRKYLEDNDVNKAKAYLGKISIPIDTVYQYVWCENEIINLILNTKIQEAKKKNIRIDANIENVFFQMAENDLCSILSNLLENAVEACEKIIDHERWIRIHMIQRSGCLMLKIENNISEQPKEKQGVYITNKTGSHGYGLKSVQSVVNKYHGTMKCAHNEETFSVVISFMQEGR